MSLKSKKLFVDGYLLPTSKSRDTKTRAKIQNPAVISFRCCAPIEELVVIFYSPIIKGEEIAFKNG